MVRKERQILLEVQLDVQREVMRRYSSTELRTRRCCWSEVDSLPTGRQEFCSFILPKHSIELIR
ncbi:hypothetical protein C0J52_21517 [Blattella germanica]|nr:hypothetical protein C0J52_21517 [Blattella germanica]